MRDGRVLVAFASPNGSTAVIAEAITAELCAAGFRVDCSLVAAVDDLAPYRAVILGSGVFLPRRRSDGGGFLIRHAPALASRALWLYCAGPIGRGLGTRSAGSHVAEDGSVAEFAHGAEDGSVAEVARAVGARGSAVFGAPVPLHGDDTVDRATPVDLDRVRAWARAIAVALDDAPGPTAKPVPAGPGSRARRRPRCGEAAATG
jgi:menaquinone-dependent protoporphyrinogen oxidase